MCTTALPSYQMLVHNYLLVLLKTRLLINYNKFINHKPDLKLKKTVGKAKISTDPKRNLIIIFLTLTLLSINSPWLKPQGEKHN